MARKKGKQVAAKAPPHPQKNASPLLVAVALAVAGVAAFVARARSPSADDALAALSAALASDSGGWAADVAPRQLLAGLAGRSFCDFDVVNASALDAAALERYRRTRTPVLLRGAASRWKAGRRWRKETLREAYAGRATQYGAGSDIVFAGGGVTNHATLRALLDRVDAATAALANDSTSTLADDVFAFDVSVLDAIPELRGDFSTPKLLQKAFPKKLLGGAHWQLLSLGPSRAGLPMHAHGETWLGVVHGAKRWFCYELGDGPPRDVSAALHPLASARAWYGAVYGQARHLPKTCLQRAGDVFYLPPGWKHATLNVGETVAVGGQLGYGAAERFEFSKKALAADPRDVEALHGAGIAAAHLAFEGRPELFRESVAYLSRAAEERPLQPEVNIILGEVLAGAGDTAAAARAVERCRDAYRAAAARPPLAGAPSPTALAAVHLKFGRFFLGAAMWDRALAPLGDAIALRPDYAEAFKDRAHAHEKLGDRRASTADLERAFAIAPDDAAIPPLLCASSNGRSPACASLPDGGRSLAP